MCAEQLAAMWAKVVIPVGMNVTTEKWARITDRKLHSVN
jgi:hypothetical protein